MDKDTIKKLANNIMFDVNEKEIELIQKNFDEIEVLLKLFDKIDTTNVKEMIFPFDVQTSYLREDEVSNVIESKQAVKNAHKSVLDHVVVPRVVK